MRYPKEVYDQTIALLSARRQQAELTAERNRTEVYEKLPQVREIDFELSRTSLRVAKAVLARDADIPMLIEGLRQRNQSLEAKKRALLRKAGYAEDYLEEKYHCPQCEDRGYIDGRRCVCMQNELKAAAFERLNEVSPLRLCSFDGFSLEYYSKEPETNGRSPHEQMRKIYESCVDYAAHFSRQAGSLLLYGGTGLGKTHLSLSIARVAIERGFGAVYDSAPNFFAKLERAHFTTKDDNTEQELMSAALECDLLILDDLGTEFLTSYVMSALYNIINTRDNLSLPVIINTNLQLAQMQEKYTDRIVSRILSGYNIFRFSGRDIRQSRREQLRS